MDIKISPAVSGVNCTSYLLAGDVWKCQHNTTVASNK